MSPTGAGDPSRQAVLGLPAQPCSSATSGGSHSGQSALLGPAKQCRRGPGVYSGTDPRRAVAFSMPDSTALTKIECVAKREVGTEQPAP